MAHGAAEITLGAGDDVPHPAPFPIAGFPFVRYNRVVKNFKTASSEDAMDYFEYDLAPEEVKSRIRAAAEEAKRPEAVMPGLFSFVWIGQDDRLFGSVEENRVWLLKKPVIDLRLPLWYFSGTIAWERGRTVIEGRFRLSPTFLMRHICLRLVVILLIAGFAAAEFGSTNTFLIMAAVLISLFLLVDGIGWLLLLGSVRYVKRFLTQLK